MNKPKLTIIGCGFMGKQIAASFINAGLEVCLVKYGPASSQDLAQVQAACQKLLADPAEASALTVVSYKDYRQQGQTSGLVIESIIEDQAAKQALFADLGQVLASEVLLATNTSSLSIQALAEKLSPELKQNFLGLHFFAPVTSNPLVEVIPHPDLADEKVQALCQWLSHRVGKNISLPRTSRALSPTGLLFTVIMTLCAGLKPSTGSLAKVMPCLASISDERRWGPTA